MCVYMCFKFRLFPCLVHTVQFLTWLATTPEVEWLNNSSSACKDNNNNNNSSSSSSSSRSSSRNVDMGVAKGTMRMRLQGRRILSGSDRQW